MKKLLTGLTCFILLTSYNGTKPSSDYDIAAFYNGLKPDDGTKVLDSRVDIQLAYRGNL